MGKPQKPSTRTECPESPHPAPREQGTFGAHTQWLIWKGAFQKVLCPGGRWEPYGHGPQLPSGWGETPITRCPRLPGPAHAAYGP